MVICLGNFDSLDCETPTCCTTVRCTSYTALQFGVRSFQWKKAFMVCKALNSQKQNFCGSLSNNKATFIALVYIVMVRKNNLLVDWNQLKMIRSFVLQATQCSFFAFSTVCNHEEYI